MGPKLRFVKARRPAEACQSWTAVYRGWNVEIEQDNCTYLYYSFHVVVSCPLWNVWVVNEYASSYRTARKLVVDAFIVLGVWEGILNAE